MNSQVLNAPVWIKKFLCQFAGYYDGRLHRFALGSDNKLSLIKDEAVEHPKVLIVGRGYYTEKTVTYPIDNKKDLKKLIALELSATPRSKSQLWPATEGQAKVNYWQFQEGLPDAAMTVPESLLLGNLIAPQEVLAVEGRHQMFVTRFNDSLHSAKIGGLLSSLERFCLSIGMATETSVRQVTESDFADALAMGFKETPLAVLSGMLSLPEVREPLSLVKRVAIPFVGVLTVYLLASSGYISYRQSQLQTLLEQQNQEVAGALDLQQQLDRQMARYRALDGFLQLQRPSSPLWLVLGDLFPYANLTNVRIVDGRVVVRGNAPKATELLEKVSSSPFAVNAKFDYPTQKRRGRDQFVLSFELTAARGVDHIQERLNGNS